MTPQELFDDVSRSPPGEKLEYYRGFLSCDMEASFGEKKLRMWKIYQMSRSLMQYGVVTLVQKRIAEREYAYYVIRTKKQGIPPVLRIVAERLERAVKVRTPEPWWGNSTIS